MRKITVHMISLVPFSLNVHSSVYNSQRKFPNRIHDLTMSIIVQLLKYMPRMHSKAFNKLYNVCVTHRPSFINDAKHSDHIFLFKNPLLQVSEVMNSHHRAKVDCERVQKRGLRRQEEAGSL